MTTPACPEDYPDSPSSQSTGPIDLHNSGVSWLLNTAEAFQKTIILVTHDPLAAARADRVLQLDKGRLVADVIQETSISAAS